MDSRGPTGRGFLDRHYVEVSTILTTPISSLLSSHSFHCSTHLRHIGQSRPELAYLATAPDWQCAWDESVRGPYLRS